MHCEFKMAALFLKRTIKPSISSNKPPPPSKGSEKNTPPDKNKLYLGGLNRENTVVHEAEGLTLLKLRKTS